MPPCPPLSSLPLSLSFSICSEYKYYDQEFFKIRFRNVNPLFTYEEKTIFMKDPKIQI